MIIYVVTSGDYSDYGICAMFSTREKAENYVYEYNKANGDTANDIDEWTLDEQEDYISKPVFLSRIQLKDGTIKDHEPEIELANPNVRFLELRGPYGGYNSDYKESGFLVLKSGVSQKHARKLAAEARQEYLRLGTITGTWMEREEIEKQINDEAGVAELADAPDSKDS